MKTVGLGVRLFLFYTLLFLIGRLSFFLLNIQDNGFDITLIEGDSTQSIPKFFDKYSFKYEFMFIDGGHGGEVPYKDIINTMEHLKVGGIFVVDDYTVGSVSSCYKKVDWSDFKEQPVPSIEKRIKVLKKIK